MLHQLFANQVLWIALFACGLAQAIKLSLALLQSKRMDLKVLVQTGGMPSSHAALVTALAVGVGIEEGWDSLLFAATVVFALIVMYDAAGVRQAAGKQAQVLNRLVKHTFDDKDHDEPYLKELLGHTPFQVLMGSLLGGGCIALADLIWGL